MARLIEKPTIIEAAGNKPKRIEEFVGLVNSGTAAVSVARMTSPSGWVEPGQTPRVRRVHARAARHAAGRDADGHAGGACGPGRRGGGRGVGALQHAPRGRRRVRGRVPARLLARQRPPRRGLRARSRGSGSGPAGLRPAPRARRALARKPSRSAASSTPRAMVSTSAAAAAKARSRGGLVAQPPLQQAQHAARLPGLERGWECVERARAPRRAAPRPRARPAGGRARPRPEPRGGARVAAGAAGEWRSGGAGSARSSAVSKAPRAV